MNTVYLKADNLSKNFGRRAIFRDISFQLSNGQSLAVTGRNGSGKSTLVKILAGVLSSSKGRVTIQQNGSEVGVEDSRNYIGFVSPYLQLYDEFTALENLSFLSRIRGNGEPGADRVRFLLERFGLWNRRNDLVRTYSSGMKQRAKYAFALLHSPQILILDEPTSNLDADGITAVQEIVREQKSSSILVIATNDRAESGWCDSEIRLGDGGVSDGSG
jgi:heme exporter protein A